MDTSPYFGTYTWQKGHLIDKRIKELPSPYPLRKMELGASFFRLKSPE